MKNSGNASVEAVPVRGPRSSTESLLVESTVANAVSISPIPMSERGYVRPLSFVSRHGGKLSLSFPVQIPDQETESARLTPTSSDASIGEPSPAANFISIPTPNDSGAFLVALATQERKVLELKEEFSKAEAELKKLKRQWAMHEANIKRAEVQLQPSKPRIPDIEGPRGNKEECYISRRSVDVDRRRGVLAGINKDFSRRKVLTGGHTRTLSLLSSDRSPDGQSTPNSVSAESSKGLINPPTCVPRSATLLEAGPSLSGMNLNRTRHSFQDDATIGVKQIAEDIKFSLWTFMDDLRQATIGEEAIMPKVSVKAGSRKSLLVSEQYKNQSSTRESSTFRSFERANLTQILADDAIESREEDPKLVAQTPPPRIKSAAVPTPDRLDDDDWSNWDSPVSHQESSRWSNSTALSSQEDIGRSDLISPLNNSEAMQSTFAPSRDQKRVEASWTALNNFTPSNIKKTASAIMKEWEQSLMPLPEERRHPLCRSVVAGKRALQEQESRLLLNNLP